MSKGRMLAAVVVLVLAAGTTSAQDRSKYYTNQHPEKFAPLDWIAFYDAIDAGTAKARKELPHHLDLAFGKDPKQKLDLYLPKEQPDGAATFLFLPVAGSGREIARTTAISRFLLPSTGSSPRWRAIG